MTLSFLLGLGLRALQDDLPVKKLLQRVFVEVLSQPNSSTLLLQAVPSHLASQPGFLCDLADLLELGVAQQLQLGLVVWSSGLFTFQEQGER